MNTKVNFYFDKAGKWREAIESLREIVLETGLSEVLKWGAPCYTLDGKNIVLIHVFKDYCALLFFKGAIMNDPAGLLVHQTKNVQSARQIRFTDVNEVKKLAKKIQACIREAIRVEESGIKMPLKTTREFDMPDEFKEALRETKGLKKAFESLTPGRQRAYLLYFSQAKQSATRYTRVKKFIPIILAGKGLDD